MPCRYGSRGMRVRLHCTSRGYVPVSPIYDRDHIVLDGGWARVFVKNGYIYKAIFYGDRDSNYEGATYWYASDWGGLYK